LASNETFLTSIYPQDTLFTPNHKKNWK